MKKKILSMLMTALIVCMMMPTVAFAGITDTGDEGDDGVAIVKKYDTVITISPVPDNTYIDLEDENTDLYIKTSDHFAEPEDSDTVKNWIETASSELDVVLSQEGYTKGELERYDLGTSVSYYSPQIKDQSGELIVVDDLDELIDAYIALDAPVDYLEIYTCTKACYVYHETPSHSIIEGDGQEHIITGGKDLTVRAGGRLDNFTGIKVDGTEVAADNYTVTSGSTIVTLKSAFLDTLPEGTHVLTVVFDDGSVDATFTNLVKPAEVTPPTAKPEAPATEAPATEAPATPPVNSPNTGDMDFIYVVMIMLLALTGMVVVKRKIEE